MSSSRLLQGCKPWTINRSLINFRQGCQSSKSPRRYLRNGRTEGQTRKNIESLATPFESLAFDPRKFNLANLVKPFLFTVGFSGTCFGTMAILEYENMRQQAVEMMRKPLMSFRRQFEQRSNRINREIRKWWNGLSNGEKVFVPICALNVAVFLAWRVPRLEPFMLRYFCSNPANKAVCWPMLLSTFSHYNPLHLLANMYVLHSFSTGAAHSLGKEQFLGLYLSAGVIANFASYICKTIRKQPGLSLGASGAIMAILGYICTQYPDTRLGIIFVPMLTFSAGMTIKFILGIDTLGVLLGWRLLDHAAHLGGSCFGIFWALYGNREVWLKREPLLHYWHYIRGAAK